MGHRGKFARRRWLIPGSDEFVEMIDGSEPWGEAMFRRVRRRWRNGGRAVVMSEWREPGMRPLGFWLCDIARADLRRAEKSCSCWAECVLLLGIADHDERRAIKETDEIAKQVTFLKKDRKKYPEDHIGVVW